MNPKSIKKQFEKSLGTYNKHAVFQRVMAEKIVSEVFKIRKEYNNILELGCGAGLLTNEIVNNINFKQYYANDLVEKSEKLIKNIIPTCQFICGDARKIRPTQKMDLIISNAMFQWLENLEKVSEIYRTMLNPNGILAFSSFTPDNYKEIRELTGLSLGYKTLGETRKIFEKNYKILCAKEIESVLNFSNPLELLAHMKNTGVNSLAESSWTFRDVKNFCDRYKEKYSDVRLTYAGMIMICQRLK